MTEHLDRAGVPQDDEHHLARIRHHFSDAQIVCSMAGPPACSRRIAIPRAGAWCRSRSIPRSRARAGPPPAGRPAGTGRRRGRAGDAVGAGRQPRAGSTRRWASRPRKPGQEIEMRYTPRAPRAPGHIRGPLGGVNRAGPDFSGRGISKSGQRLSQAVPNQLFPRGTPCATPQPCWPLPAPPYSRPPSGQPVKPRTASCPSRSRHDPLHLRQGRGRQERLQRPVRQDLAARHAPPPTPRPPATSPSSPATTAASGRPTRASRSICTARTPRRQRRRQLQDVWHAAKP